MRVSAFFLACQLLFLCTGKIMFGQSLVQNLTSNSYLDWKNFTIRATGNSSLVSDERSQKVQALERARLGAVNNLFSAVKQLRIDGNSDLKDLLNREPALQPQIRNAIKRFTIVDTRSMSDMSVEIDIDFSVTEHLLPLLLSKDTGQGRLRLSSEPLCPTCGQPWPANRPVPEGVTLIIPSEGYTNAHGKAFSGLVIDATKQDLNPTLFPKILTEDKQEVYGISYVDRESAIELGVVGYKTDLNRAIRDERVAPAPLVIPALQVSGENNANIIVSNSDAVLIHAAAKIQNFLKDCKVIIVTN